jgi:hypothetical protein
MVLVSLTAAIGFTGNARVARQQIAHLEKQRAGDHQRLIDGPRMCSRSARPRPAGRSSR